MEYNFNNGEEILYADVVFVSNPLRFSSAEVRNAKKYQFKTHIKNLIKYNTVSILSLDNNLGFAVFVGYSEKKSYIRNHAILVNKIDVDGAQKEVSKIENSRKDRLSQALARDINAKLKSPLILDIISNMDPVINSNLAEYEKVTGKKFTFAELQKENEKKNEEPEKAPF